MLLITISRRGRILGRLHLMTGRVRRWHLRRPLECQRWYHVPSRCALSHCYVRILGCGLFWHRGAVAPWR